MLGPSGTRVDVASSSSLAIARFSRWCRRLVPVPRSADDPKGYLAAIAAALRRDRYDALLPTLALMLGAAESTRSRAAALRALLVDAVRARVTSRASGSADDG